LAILYQKLGAMLNAQGRIQNALWAYESALKALNKENHQLDATINQLRRVSKSYHSEPKIIIPDIYSPSIALSIKEAINDENLSIKLLFYIGNSYFHQPQLDPALNSYQQILIQNNIDGNP